MINEKLGLHCGPYVFWCQQTTSPCLLVNNLPMTDLDQPYKYALPLNCNVVSIFCSNEWNNSVYAVNNIYIVMKNLYGIANLGDNSSSLITANMKIENPYFMLKLSFINRSQDDEKDKTEPKLDKPIVHESCLYPIIVEENWAIKSVIFLEGFPECSPINMGNLFAAYIVDLSLYPRDPNRHLIVIYRLKGKTIDLSSGHLLSNEQICSFKLSTVPMFVNRLFWMSEAKRLVVMYNDDKVKYFDLSNIHTNRMISFYQVDINLIQSSISPSLSVMELTSKKRKWIDDHIYLADLKKVGIIPLVHGAICRIAIVMYNEKLQEFYLLTCIPSRGNLIVFQPIFTLGNLSNCEKQTNNIVSIDNNSGYVLTTSSLENLKRSLNIHL